MDRLASKDMVFLNNHSQQAVCGPTRARLIVSVPGMPSKTKTDALTEFLDIFPTLCVRSGLSTPSGLDGVLHMPLMDGSKSSVKDFARSQYPRNHEGKV